MYVQNIFIESNAYTVVTSRSTSLLVAPQKVQKLNCSHSTGCLTSKWFFKLSLTDGKMQARICLNVVLTSWDYGIQFQRTFFKASDRKYAKIHHDFHDSTKKNYYNDQNKPLFKNLDNFDVFNSDFEALKPLQPPKPHYPLQPLQPYLFKGLPGPNDLIISGTKMTNTCTFLWN